MKWQTLTKDVFPDIMEKENITFEWTLGAFTVTTYKSKRAYIIAMDNEHMPDDNCNCNVPVIDDKYIIRMFTAEHTVYTDIETGEIKRERKEFHSPDCGDGMTISINDKNLKYCKYKTVELESILN